MKIINTKEEMKGIEPEVLVVESIYEKTETTRSDGKQSRKYVNISFFSKESPDESHPRNFFQEHDSKGVPVWRGGMHLLKPGDEILGKIIRFKTERYFIPSEYGKSTDIINGQTIKGNYVDEYKTMVTKGELEGEENTLLKVLKASQHRLATDPAPAATARVGVDVTKTAAVAATETVKEDEKVF